MGIPSFAQSLCRARVLGRVVQHHEIGLRARIASRLGLIPSPRLSTSLCLGGIVAPGRPADQPVPRSDREQQLGRGRDERSDPAGREPHRHTVPASSTIATAARPCAAGGSRSPQRQHDPRQLIAPDLGSKHRLQLFLESRAVGLIGGPLGLPPPRPPARDSGRRAPRAVEESLLGRRTRLSPRHAAAPVAGATHARPSAIAEAPTSAASTATGALGGPGSLTEITPPAGIAPVNRRNAAPADHLRIGEGQSRRARRRPRLLQQHVHRACPRVRRESAPPSGRAADDTETRAPSLPDRSAPP